MRPSAKAFMTPWIQIIYCPHWFHCVCSPHFISMSTILQRQFKGQCNWPSVLSFLSCLYLILWVFVLIYCFNCSVSILNSLKKQNLISLSKNSGPINSIQNKDSFWEYLKWWGPLSAPGCFQHYSETDLRGKALWAATQSSDWLRSGIAWLGYGLIPTLPPPPESYWILNHLHDQVVFTKLCFIPGDYFAGHKRE